MKPKELNELAERYRSTSTEDLIKASTVDREDYQEEALKLIDEELAKRNVSLQQQNDVQARIRHDKRIRDDQLVGVRGWLLVFIVILGLSSLYDLLASIAYISGSRGIATLLINLPRPLVGAYGFFALALLITRKPSAPDHARRFLIATVVFSLFIDLLDLASSNFTRESTFTRLVPYFGAAIWFSYLGQSRRVALTYRREDKASNQTVEATADPPSS